MEGWLRPSTKGDESGGGSLLLPPFARGGWGGLTVVSCPHTEPRNLRWRCLQVAPSGRVPSLILPLPPLAKGGEHLGPAFARKCCFGLALWQFDSGNHSFHFSGVDWSEKDLRSRAAGLMPAGASRGDV